MTRLQEYRAALDTSLRSADLHQVEILLRRIRDDCVGYLQETEDRMFPTLEFTFCYNRYDYDTAVSSHGGDPRNTFGFSVGTKLGRNLIYIDVETPFRLLQSESPNTFVINVSLVILEELLHVLYPQLSEDDITPMTRQLTENFLGIQLPQAFS